MSSWVLRFLDFLDRFAGKVHTRHIICFLKLFGCEATRVDHRLLSDPNLSLLLGAIIVLWRRALI